MSIKDCCICVKIVKIFYLGHEVMDPETIRILDPANFFGVLGNFCHRVQLSVQNYLRTHIAPLTHSTDVVMGKKGL